MEFNELQNGLVYKIIKSDKGETTDKLLVGREKALVLQLEMKVVEKQKTLIGVVYLTHWKDGKIKINSDVRVEVNGEILKTFGINNSGEVDIHLDVSDIQPGTTLLFITDDGVSSVWSIEPLQEPLTKIEQLSTEVKEIKTHLSTTSAKYDALDKIETGLEELKYARILKLKEECSNAIYEGFTSESTGYFFGFNEQDQVNFTQRMLTIVAGAAGPFKWKTKDVGVVELTKEEFTTLVQEAEDHKLIQQEHYWQLEEQILAAETNEVADAITW